MGSPLGPILANALLCFRELIWLNEGLDEVKPVYYRWYIDVIFVLFFWPVHFKKFKNYSNSKHRNIRFTCERKT